MIAVFNARCKSNEVGLIKGMRYKVSEVNGNFIQIEDVEGNFDISLFEIEKVYFSHGKTLPEVGKPLTNIVRFNGNAWEKILETSLVEEIVLLNDHTFLIQTNHSLYVYQLPNKKIKLTYLISKLPLAYLAIGKILPKEGSPLSEILFLDKDNSWKSTDVTDMVKAVAMLSKNNYLVITATTQYMYIVKE